jgi:outer membrane protein
LNEYIRLQSNAIPTTISSVFMKKSLSILSALTLAAPVAAFAQVTVKIGTVDMQRAFKEYNKTKEAEAKINDAKNAAKKEYDDRAEAYKKALDEINNLNKQLESAALSADKKTGMAKERDDKIANIKSMEREISEFRQTREQQLQQQLMRMREGLVKEITDVVMEKVKAKSLDFVLDKSGISINGVPVVMYAPENVDFTNEIIDTLNKPGRATASNKKAATSPSATPAAKAAKP